MTPPALEEHSPIHTLSEPRTKGHASRKLEHTEEMKLDGDSAVSCETALMEWCSELGYTPLPHDPATHHFRMSIQKWRQPAKAQIQA